MTAATMEKGPTGVDPVLEKDDREQGVPLEDGAVGCDCWRGDDRVDPVVNSLFTDVSQALGMDSGTRALCIEYRDAHPHRRTAR